MGTLYAIKGGDRGPAICAQMAGYARELVEAGAETVLAGCTEVPLVLGPADVSVPFIDPGELLARRCVAVCLGLEPMPQAYETN